MRQEDTIPDLCRGRPLGRQAGLVSGRHRSFYCWRESCEFSQDGSWRLGSVAAGTGGIFEGDGDGLVVGIFYVADLAEGAEKLGGDVGEDASALGGDAIADEEKQEPGQELVDLVGGVEFGELIEKVGGKVVRVLLVVAEAGVTEAETGAGIPDGKLTGMACTGALLATDSALRLARFAIALGKLGKLGGGNGQVLRRERVR
jgi:hypothetical protein